MEHINGGVDATQVPAGDVPSAPNPDNGGSNSSNPFAPFGSPISGSSASSFPVASTLFGSPPPTLTEAASPQGFLQFPPPSENVPTVLTFGRKTTPSSDPTSAPPFNGQDKAAATAPSFRTQGASSSPFSTLSGFGSSFGVYSSGVNASPQLTSSSDPSFATPAFGGSAPVFGSSAGASTVPAFGCFRPSNPLFQTLAAATTAPRTPSGPFPFSINSSAAPSGFSCTFNGFNQGLWAAPGFTPRWANAKRCYCGKVAGIRFSNKTDGTLGMFYCCPDHNEEAIRNGTQDRNYCTYREWSNSFSFVRRCFCGKVAMLQKSQKFDTWERLFYSCPEYREKDVMAGRCYRDHCSYMEWCRPPMPF